MGNSRLFRFDRFVLDTKAQALFHNGEQVKLTGQPYLILQFLLERAGEVVTRDELRQKLWPGDTFVDFQRCLSTSVMSVRRVLGDSAETPRYIATVPRVGYRFIASLAATDGTPETSSAAKVAAAEAPVELATKGSGDRKSYQLIRRNLKPCAFGMAVAMAALLLRELLAPFLGQYYPELTLWLAVVLVARKWGTGAAIAALATGGLGAWYFFVPPPHSFRIIQRADLFGLAGFVTFSLVIISLLSPDHSESART